MPSSIFLARLMGPMFVAIGAGMLFNPAIYDTMAAEFLRSYALIYLSGLIVLLGGLAIVNVHNSWAFDWRLIITIFGWLAVVGGVLRIVVPQFVQSVGTVMVAQSGLLVGAAIFVIALGGFLSFKGYSQ